jgi:hypothetical protein
VVEEVNGVGSRPFRDMTVDSMLVERSKAWRSLAEIRKADDSLKCANFSGFDTYLLTYLFSILFRARNLLDLQ